MAGTSRTVRRLAPRIRTQAVLLSVVPLSFLVMLLVIAGALQGETDRMAREMQRSTIALTDSEAVRHVIVDAERPALEYTREQRPAYYRQYETTVAGLPARMSALQRDVAAQREQSTLAARYLTLTRKVVDAVLTPYMNMLRAGKKKEATAFGRSPSVQKLGLAWDKSRTDFEAAERRITLARVVTVQHDIALLGVALLAVCVAGIVLTLLVTGLFGMRIARRLLRLTENARRLGRGEPTDVIGGRDEIADLDAVYHEMTRRVQESLRAKEEALAAYERAHHVATTLQRALLPQDLPALPGILFDGVYVPGVDEAQVGGDWYDALRLADGRVLLAIGDVAGNGLQAAIIMAAMREVIRGVAHVYADPATIVDAADRTLKTEHPDRLVTAIVAVFDPVAHTLTYCSAGHPAPLMRLTDGTVVELPARGLPLGLRERNDVDAQTLDVPDGATIVLYTDGLTESRQDILDGERRLRDALADPVLAARPDPARALHDRLLADGTHDDVAILVMRLDAVPAAAHAPTWAFDTGDTATAQHARADFAAVLAGRLHDDDVFTAELIFGELLSNAVRYASGGVEVVLDLGDAARPTLHFLDRGPGFVLIPRLPGDLLSERGRGLFLVWSLSDEFNVTKRAAGGSHVRVVLARTRRLPSANGAANAGPRLVPTRP